MQMYTVPDVAKILKLHPGTVWRMIREGSIGHVRLGRTVRVTEAQIEALSNPKAVPPKGE